MESDADFADTNTKDAELSAKGLAEKAPERMRVEVKTQSSIGSDANTELGDPAIAPHLDDVYVPRPRGLGVAFFDIERVEVNVGPQGTVRGRNALGGTVNIE